MIVDRRHSCNRDKGISTDAEVAPHILLSMKDMATGIVKRETLDIRVFFDVSVLEIFVNDRVAITTRVYPDSGKCFGVGAWVEEGAHAKLVRCKAWELKTGVR